MELLSIIAMSGAARIDVHQHLLPPEFLAALERHGMSDWAPRHRLLPELASGSLVEVLADFPPTPTPISLLYPGDRKLSFFSTKLWPCTLRSFGHGGASSKTQSHD